VVIEALQSTYFRRDLRHGRASTGSEIATRVQISTKE
jgi:hypothetical protein